MQIKFISYLENHDAQAKFKGIAAVSLENTIVLRYKVLEAKNGRGLFFAPFSGRQNDNWVESHSIDSRQLNDDILSLLRQEVNGFYNKKSKNQVSDDCPF